MFGRADVPSDLVELRTWQLRTVRAVEFDGKPAAKVAQAIPSRFGYFRGTHVSHWAKVLLTEGVDGLDGPAAMWRRFSAEDLREIRRELVAGQGDLSGRETSRSKGLLANQSGRSTETFTLRGWTALWLLAAQGRTMSDVARALGVHRTIVLRAARKYLAREHETRPGLRPTLPLASRAQKRELMQALAWLRTGRLVAGIGRPQGPELAYRLQQLTALVAVALGATAIAAAEQVSLNEATVRKWWSLYLRDGLTALPAAPRGTHWATPVQQDAIQRQLALVVAGRPSLFGGDLGPLARRHWTRILRVLKDVLVDGRSYEDTSAAHGVSKETISNWLVLFRKHGLEGFPRPRDLVLRVTQSQADHLERTLARRRADPNAGAGELLVLTVLRSAVQEGIEAATGKGIAPAILSDWLRELLRWPDRELHLSWPPEATVLKLVDRAGHLSFRELVSVLRETGMPEAAVLPVVDELVARRELSRWFDDGKMMLALPPQRDPGGTKSIPVAGFAFASIALPSLAWLAADRRPRDARRDRADRVDPGGRVRARPDAAAEQAERARPRRRAGARAPRCACAIRADEASALAAAPDRRRRGGRCGRRAVRARADLRPVRGSDAR